MNKIKQIMEEINIISDKLAPCSIIDCATDEECLVIPEESLKIILEKYLKEEIE